MKKKTSHSLTLRPKSVVALLYIITALLTVVHIAVLCVYYWVDDEEKFDFVRLIDMDYEGNLPTLFSATLFFVAAMLFWLLGRWERHSPQPGITENANRFCWLGLAAVFTFLGVDEGAKLHEHVGDYMEKYIEAEGFLYFPWIVPYIAIFMILVLIYLPFFFRLSTETRIGMVISATLFLCGAVVLDSIGGWEADRNGTSSMLYSALYTIEEVLEMIGLIVLISTLLNTLVVRDFSLAAKAPAAK